MNISGETLSEIHYKFVEDLQKGDVVNEVQETLCAIQRIEASNK